MTSIQHIARLAFPLVALAAASCSSSSSSSSSAGPVIDDLTVPPTFTVSGNQYSVQGTISYHDSSALVTMLHEKIPAYGADSKAAVPGQQQGTNVGILLGFDSSAAVPSGTQVEIDLSLIDANGKESNVEVEHVTVP